MPRTNETLLPRKNSRVLNSLPSRLAPSERSAEDECRERSATDSAWRCAAAKHRASARRTGQTQKPTAPAACRATFPQCPRRRRGSRQNSRQPLPYGLTRQLAPPSAVLPRPCRPSSSKQCGSRDRPDNSPSRCRPGRATACRLDQLHVFGCSGASRQAATRDSNKDKEGTQHGGSGSGKLTIPHYKACLLYTSPSPRDRTRSRMPSSA